jgi:hypothetical protein
MKRATAPKGIKTSRAIVSEFGVMKAGTLTTHAPLNLRPWIQ